MIEVRWHGRGGQGSFTVARLLGVAASVYGGDFAQAFPSFGPERRGAPVLGFTRISKDKITDRSELDLCDYVVVLDETLWGDDVTSGLKEDTVIIINTSESKKYVNDTSNRVIAIDATTLALEYLGQPITNTAMLGALSAACDEIDAENCKKAIASTMNERIASKNIVLFDKAYEAAKEAMRV